MRLSGGGNSADSPGTSRWDVTFGAAVLCRAAGGPVVLQSVRYETRVKPNSIRTVLRLAPSKADRDPTDDGSLTGSAYGIPTKYKGTPSRAFGTLLNSVSGFRVTQSCSGLDRNVDSHTEMLTVMSVAETGAWTTGIVIEYKQDGKLFTVHSDWNYIACGSKTMSSDAC